MSFNKLNFPAVPFLVGDTRPIDPAWVQWLMAPRVSALYFATPNEPAKLATIDDASAMLAARAFMPHVPLTQPPAPDIPVDDATAMLAARAFMPHVPLVQAPVIPTVPTSDDAGAMLAARAFMPHVPMTQSTLPQEMATILATQIFGP